jgi:hypothetical protein
MAEEATTSTESEMPTTDAPQSEMDTTAETNETLATEPTNEQPQSQPSTDDLSKELENLRSALKKANAEAAKHRKDAKELAVYRDQIESEKLSEQEKLQKQLADLQKAHDDTVRQAQEYKVNTEVRLQAAQSGFSDPNDAVKFLDWSEIEYDDNGAPANVNDLVADLLKAKPYLAKPQNRPAPAVSATNPSRSNRVSDDPTEYINRLKAGTLKPEEYNALPASTRAKILDAMSKHR